MIWFGLILLYIGIGLSVAYVAYRVIAHYEPERVYNDMEEYITATSFVLAWPLLLFFGAVVGTMWLIHKVVTPSRG